MDTATDAPPLPVSVNEPSSVLGGIDVGSPRIRHALQCSLADGILYQIMFVLGETFFVAAALTLKAPAVAISLLGCLPLFLGSFLQAGALFLVNPSHGRKHYILPSVRLQCASLIVAAVAGWLSPAIAPWTFVAAVAVYGISGLLFNNLWMTWFSDLVPDEIMGRHTAWRNLFFSSTQLAGALLVGSLSRHFTVHTTPWLFFAVMLSLAAVARFGSSVAITLQFEPPWEARRKIDFKGFRPSRDLLTYAFAGALFQGSAAMAGPFFSVFFLRDLKMDYLEFTIATSCTAMGVMVSLPLWGRLVDYSGTARVLRLSAFLGATVPFPFLFADCAWQVWLFNFYAGLAWTGLNVAGFKHVLQVAEPGSPERGLTLASCIMGTSVLLFGLSGGFLATHLPTIFEYRLQTLFLLSALARFAVFATLFTRIRDSGRTLSLRSTIGNAVFAIFHWRRHLSSGRL